LKEKKKEEKSENNKLLNNSKRKKKKKKEKRKKKPDSEKWKNYKPNKPNNKFTNNKIKIDFLLYL
jgi:hypothetical protein